MLNSLCILSKWIINQSNKWEREAQTGENAPPAMALNLLSSVALTLYFSSVFVFLDAPKAFALTKLFYEYFKFYALKNLDITGTNFMLTLSANN